MHHEETKGFRDMGGRSCADCHCRMCVCGGDILSLREAAGAAISGERAALHIVRIQCVPQNGGEVETITGILPYDGGYAFDLKSGSFVYRVIAEWDDGNRVEYGFIGKWL